MELKMLSISGSLVVRTASVEESGSFRRGKHSAALFHKHIDTLLKSKNAVNDMENTWIQTFKLEQSCVDELWIQNWSGLNQTILEC